MGTHKKNKPMKNNPR